MSSIYIIDNEDYFNNSHCSYEEICIDHTDKNVKETEDLILHMRHCRTANGLQGFSGIIINRYGNYIHRTMGFTAGVNQAAYDKAVELAIVKMNEEQKKRDERDKPKT